MNDYQPCHECGELEAHDNHSSAHHGDHIFETWCAGCVSHEYEPGCYCADSGRCEVCVERAVDAADYMRKAAKEERAL